MSVTTSIKEGGLEAPTRHAIDWKNPKFYDQTSLNKELERVFDICHGCRRCVSLCRAFPTLFDLVDESATMEVDGVAKQDYGKVVDQCYLCDLCYMTKCPYVPPHEWNLDFPHLMLRAKAVKFKQNSTSFRDRVISETDTVGRFASLPVVVNFVNAANKNSSVRKLLHNTLGIHAEAKLPPYRRSELAQQLAAEGRAVNEAPHATAADPVTAGPTSGKVALFGTCYGNYCEPHLGEDLAAVFKHNSVPVTLVAGEQCCGMPKLELGDMQSVRRAKEANIGLLVKLVDAGWDIVAPIPSCVLMFKQELPLMFPDDADVQKIKAAIFDPFEYLIHRHRAGQLRTDFKTPLGKVAYHVACHQRVQNIGAKTKEVLELIPDTQVLPIERCSGHDGTYAVKTEFHDASMKIARPVVNQVKKLEPDYYGSDCPMAGHQIETGLGEGAPAPVHPLRLLKIAYGI